MSIFKKLKIKMDDKDVLWPNVTKASIFNKKYFGRSESKMTNDSKKKIEKIIEKSPVASKKKGRTIEKKTPMKESPAKKQKIEKKTVKKKVVKENTPKKEVENKIEKSSDSDKNAEEAGVSRMAKKDEDLFFVVVEKVVKSIIDSGKIETKTKPVKKGCISEKGGNDKEESEGETKSINEYEGHESKNEETESGSEEECLKDSSLEEDEKEEKETKREIEKEEENETEKEKDDKEDNEETETDEGSEEGDELEEELEEESDEDEENDDGKDEEKETATMAKEKGKSKMTTLESSKESSEEIPMKKFVQCDSPKSMYLL